MDEIAQLLLLCHRYAAHTRLSEATVSTRFLGGGARIRKLREGGDMGARFIRKVVAKFAENWPEGAAWPAEVPRPAPQSDGKAA
jgi:hypothetical protein